MKTHHQYADHDICVNTEIGAPNEFEFETTASFRLSWEEDDDPFTNSRKVEMIAFALFDEIKFGGFTITRDILVKMIGEQRVSAIEADASQHFTENAADLVEYC